MDTRKLVSAFLFQVALFQSFAAGAGQDPSALHVFAGQPAQTLSIAELPAAIRSLLEARIPEGIAAVGTPYNATDAITDESLPSRRLLGAGRTGPIWFVWYEHGGRGYHQHLALLRSEGASVEVVASSVILQRPASLEALQQLARVGALAESPQPEHW
jgi:hypothetical protein